MLCEHLTVIFRPSAIAVGVFGDRLPQTSCPVCLRVLHSTSLCLQLFEIECFLIIYSSNDVDGIINERWQVAVTGNRDGNREEFLTLAELISYRSTDDNSFPSKMTQRQFEQLLKQDAARPVESRAAIGPNHSHIRDDPGVRGMFLLTNVQ